MKRWINAAGARAFLESRYIAILDREARISYGKAPIRIRAISGGWVRNTRRVRKVLAIARKNVKEMWAVVSNNPSLAAGPKEGA